MAYLVRSADGSDALSRIGPEAEGDPHAPFLILNALPAAVYTTDAEGLITFFNAAAAELWGTRPRLAEDRWCGSWRLYHPDGRAMPHDQCPMAVTLREGRAVRGAEIIAERPDGQRVPIHPFPTPLRDADGRMIGAVNLLVDASAHKRAEALLQQARKLEAIGLLAGGIAHDFNNILAAVANGYALLRRRDASPQTAEICEIGEHAVGRAAALVRALRSFGQRQALAAQRVDIGTTLAAIGPLLNHSLAPAIVQTIDLPADLWPVAVDPAGLQIALLNLATNARDAMPEGGAFRISARNECVAPEARPDLAPGAYVALTVADSGPGMRPEVLERATDPFFTTKPVGSGAGLGLSAVAGFAAQSRGRMEIDSRVGHGTRVILHLPRAVPE